MLVHKYVQKFLNFVGLYVPCEDYIIIIKIAVFDQVS